MPTVVVCSAAPLDDALGHTVLWRQEMERFNARNTGAAVQVTRLVNPDLLLVDARLDDALDLISTVKQHALTQAVPVAVLLAQEAPGRGLEFLDAGANEVLRLPPDGEWDERLVRLFRIRARKEARYPVRFDVEVTPDEGKTTRATGINLSTGGMLLRSAAGFGVGDQLAFSFRVPGFTHPVTGRGWIVRAAGEDCYGLQYLYLEGEGLEMVRRAIEHG